MRAVRPAGPVFFPLDEELELLPGDLTPSLVEHLVRLGTWLPFKPAAHMLAHFTRVLVGATTARRLTTQAGAADEALQTAAVEQLERELPAAPQGPAVQLLSVDGAMVPLVGGEWAEVKTLALGVVQEPVVNRRGEQAGSKRSTPPTCRTSLAWPIMRPSGAWPSSRRTAGAPKPPAWSARGSMGRRG